MNRKRFFIIVCFAAVSLLFASCGTSRKVAQKQLSQEAQTLAFEDGRGDYHWPCYYLRMIHGFGEYNVTDKVKAASDGLILLVKSGTKIMALADGVVSSIIQFNDHNITVILRHGEYRTVYSRLEKVTVVEGQSVAAREVLGVVAQDPESQTHIFEFQLWNDESPLNPTDWLR